MSHTLAVMAYDPEWPKLYITEQQVLVAAVGSAFAGLEHIGSTAVPGLATKPVIDMMAAVPSLDDAYAMLPTLRALGYTLIETGMPQRLFLRKHAPQQDVTFHLHIVELATWAERNERLLRDYLLARPELALQYAQLKRRLAEKYFHDPAGYTKAKTAFIQSVVDQARDAVGLPRVSVWEE